MKVLAVTLISTIALTITCTASTSTSISSTSTVLLREAVGCGTAVPAARGRAAATASCEADICEAAICDTLAAASAFFRAVAVALSTPASLLLIGDPGGLPPSSIFPFPIICNSMKYRYCSFYNRWFIMKRGKGAVGRGVGGRGGKRGRDYFLNYDYYDIF